MMRILFPLQRGCACCGHIEEWTSEAIAAQNGWRKFHREKSSGGKKAQAFVWVEWRCAPCNDGLFARAA